MSGCLPAFQTTVRWPKATVLPPATMGWRAPPEANFFRARSSATMSTLPKWSQNRFQEGLEFGPNVTGGRFLVLIFGELLAWVAVAGRSTPGSLGTKSARYMTPKSPVRRCKSLGPPSSTLNWGQGWHPAPRGGSTSLTRSNVYLKIKPRHPCLSGFSWFAHRATAC